MNQAVIGITHPGAGHKMQVRAYVTLRDVLGKSRFEWTPPDGATVRDVLDRLVAECPAFGEKLWDADGKLTGYVQVFVNGRAVQYLDGLATTVTDCDTISLFPPVAGGSADTGALGACRRSGQTE